VCKKRAAIAENLRKRSGENDHEDGGGLFQFDIGLGASLSSSL